MVAVAQSVSPAPAAHPPGFGAATGAQPARRGLSVRGVNHRFELEGAALPVLDNIDLDIQPGEFVALLGPSGCGKSTLLRLVGTGTAGRGRAAGRRRAHRRSVAFAHRGVPGPHAVSLAHGPEQRGAGPAGARPAQTQGARVDDALQRVGLQAFGQAYPHQLSGGMAQRAALARALVNDPRILILDEPLGKLDSLTRIAMQSELVDLWQRAGFTSLLVTHDVEEALFMATRIVVLSERPARIKDEIVNDLPYPRHRGDPKLAALRHRALALLGLDATW